MTQHSLQLKPQETTEFYYHMWLPAQSPSNGGYHFNILLSQVSNSCTKWFVIKANDIVSPLDLFHIAYFRTVVLAYNIHNLA